MVSPLLKSQSLAVASEEAVTKYAASTLKTASHTHLCGDIKVMSANI